MTQQTLTLPLSELVALARYATAMLLLTSKTTADSEDARLARCALAEIMKNDPADKAQVTD